MIRNTFLICLLKKFMNVDLQSSEKLEMRGKMLHVLNSLKAGVNVT